MPADYPDHWFLKKHETGEVYGPVHFDKVQEWARSAQVNPQDMLSTDEIIWTKAPMIADLKMDWLVVVGQNLLYGPTTSGSLMEFARLGEISPDSLIVNSCSGETMALRETDFFEESQVEPAAENIIEPPAGKPMFPAPGNIRVSLQKRVRELESLLLEKRRKLVAADETIAKLDARVKELEARIREHSGLGKS